MYNGDFSEHPRHETAAFLQTWLFFGSLNEILGFPAPIDAKNFIGEHDAQLYVQTTLLYDHIALWAAELNNPDITSAEEHGKLLCRFDKCLKTVHRLWRILSNTSDSPLASEVTLSLSVLGCTIDHALQWYWGQETERNWDLNSLATARMLQSNWCPRDITVAGSILSELSMYCASYIKRPSASQDHGRCSVETCELNQVDEQTYVTKHRKIGCRCGHLGPMQEDVIRILDKGEIPVITLTPRHQPDGSRILDLQVNSGGVVFLNTFIAISHVWSDGLGNPRENSLPFCQLEYMYDLLVDYRWDSGFNQMETMGEMDIPYDDELTKRLLTVTSSVFKGILPVVKPLVNNIREFRGKPLSIWIDTLCVPLNSKNHRKVAIERMERVYAQSAFTLVLDSELVALKHNESTAQDILVRAGLSGWMRRAWTFQEGVMANRRIRPLFADGIFQLPLGPLDINKTVDERYKFPWLTSKIHELEKQRAIEDDALGIKRRPVRREFKNRIQQESENRKTFTLSKYMLEDSKKFFRSMGTVGLRGGGFISSADQVERVIAAWEGLRWRATSREDDRFLCFATACANGSEERAAIQKLLQCLPEERMKSWIQTQTVIPAGFLFLRGARYEEAGFRWAPTRVWRESIEDMAFAERHPTTGEFLFRKPGFLFDSTEAIGFAFVISHEITSQRYRVSIERKGLSARASAAVSHHRGTLGIVIRQIEALRQPGNILHREPGVLLENVSCCNNKIYGDFLCRVDIKLSIEAEMDGPAAIAKEVADTMPWIIA